MNKKVLIPGIQGTGKTFLAKKISRSFRPLVYTPHPEEWKSDGVDVILARTKDFIGDFPFWCLMAKKFRFSPKGWIDMFIVDDADLLFKSHFDTSPELRDIVINHRHYNLTLIFISRRPQDIPAKIYGQFEILCLFSIEAPQVVDLLNKYSENLGDMVKNLKYGSHDFVLKHIGQPPVIQRA